MTIESPSIFFGWNKKGEKVFIPLFHLFINATSGAGKTVILKHLLWRFHLSHPDWAILIIDSKDKREWADLNSDIPLCFVETTEPLDLKDLMEPLIGSKTLYYLDKIIEEAVFETLEEIQQVIEQKIEKADVGKIRIHSKELGKLRVINHTFKKIIAFTKQFKVTHELKLKPGFNVLNVSLPGAPLRLKTAFQQLILRSALVMLMQPQYEKVLFVHDEFHKSSPQRWSSIVKQPMSDGISEGRSKEVFFWLADQAMTKVDKEPLKPVKIWIVGQQLEDNEVQDAVNSVNDITDLKVGDKDIKRLRVGNFLVVDGVNMQVEETYFQPNGVPDELAIDIVMGNKKPQEAESYIKGFKFELGDVNLDFKEAWKREKELREKAETEREEFRRKCEKLESNFSDMRTKIYNEVMVEVEKKMSRDYIGKAEHQRIVDKLTSQITDMETKLAKTEPLRQFIKSLVDEAIPTTTVEATATIDQTIDQTTITTIVDQRLKQLIVSEPSLKIVQVDVDERIREINKEEYLRPIIETLQSLSDLAKRAVRFIYEKQKTTVGELSRFLYAQRRGRPPAVLYRHIINPLEKIALITSEGDKIQWSLTKTLQQHIKDEPEVEKIEKWILSLLL